MPDLRITGLPDAELVARTREGDVAAFDALVRRHYPAAYAVAMAQLGRREDAEDLCQDVFIRALERIDDCREPERFVGWLLQIVRNQGHNAREKRRVRDADSIDDDLLPIADTERRAQSDAHAVSEELRRALEQALRALPERQREVVLLHDLEGWSHPEVAAALGITEVNCRQYLFTARRALRAQLGANALEVYGG